MTGHEPAHPTTCTTCGAGLETPIACGDCGQLGRVDEVSPFALFGLPVAFEVDPDELERRLRRYTRLVHPDYYVAAAPGMRERAESHGAALNAGYAVLKNDLRRADWLVRHLGGPSEEDERQMPQEFLMEVLEWNEALDEAAESPPGSDARAKLEPLEAELRAQRAQAMDAVADALDPLPERGDAALVDVRKKLNAVRYLDRALRRLRDLRAGQPS